MEDDRLNRNLEELLSKHESHREVIDRLTEMDKQGKLVNFLKDSKLPIISCPAISSSGLEDSYSLAIDLLKRTCDIIYLKHRDFNKFKKIYDLYLNYYLASREVIFDVHELDSKEIGSDEFDLHEMILLFLSGIPRIPEKYMGLTYKDLKEDFKDEKIKRLFTELNSWENSGDPVDDSLRFKKRLDTILHIDFNPFFESEKYPNFKNMFEESKKHGSLAGKLDLINEKNSMPIVNEMMDYAKTLKTREGKLFYEELKSIHSRLESSKKFDKLRVEINRDFMDNIVDRTGACVFGPDGEEVCASYAYVLDPNIALLSLNPYCDDKKTERTGKASLSTYCEGKKMDSIGKAILINTRDNAGRKVLLVDGVINGPDAEACFEIGWYFAFFNNIIDAATGIDADEIVFNASHRASQSQQSIHIFNDRIADFLRLEKDYCRLSPKKGFVMNENEMPFEKEGFKYTHELFKEPMPSNRIEIMKYVRPDYSGEHYIHAWSAWNKHIAEKYNDLSEWTKNFDYVQKRIERKRKGITDYSWNSCQGPIRGIGASPEEFLKRLKDNEPRVKEMRESARRLKEKYPHLKERFKEKFID